MPGLDCVLDPTMRQICAPIPRRGEPCAGLCEEGSVCTWVTVGRRCEPDVCRVLSGIF
jgi:hypothetical protein